jgi:hypothetical protein
MTIRIAKATPNPAFMTMFLFELFILKLLHPYLPNLMKMQIAIRGQALKVVVSFEAPS